MTDDNNEGLNSMSDLPPGAWLRRVRMDKGIQPEQVCAYLGITRSRLQTLEDDDYCRLPAEVYVCGWIRRYCGMLDLPPESVLCSFEQQLALLREEKRVRQQRQLRRRQQRQLRAVMAASGALVVVAAIAWLAMGVSLDHRDQLSVATEMAEEFDAAAERPVATMPSELLGQTAAELADNELSQLEVRFSSDSWVEVLDSAGNILVADLKLANEVLVLKGVPPFEVYVANAPAVQLRYRGELLELAMTPSDQGVRTLIGDHPAEHVSSPDES